MKLFETFTILAACTLAVACGNVTGAHRREAELAARHWAIKVTPPEGRVSASCVAADSDGDGYVSCTVVVWAQGATVPAVYAIECSGAWTFNDGCRSAKARLDRTL